MKNKQHQMKELISPEQNIIFKKINLFLHYLNGEELVLVIKFQIPINHIYNVKNV